MPPKRKRKAGDTNAADDDIDGIAASKVAKKPKTAPKKSAKQFKMPPPIPDGEIFTDFSKYQWKIGGSIGKGGFGEIYLASPSGKNSEKKATQYVIKVEPHDNGPLFAELSFYRRVAKPEFMDGWAKSHKLEYLPVPRYVGSGTHQKDKVDYRFMVMERFGDDVEKLFCTVGRKFSIKTVCFLALRIIEALVYLHDHEFVHADIKGSNLLTGHLAADKHKVYLVDYGLAYRYICDGEHQKYKVDPKSCHDGTIEFTSIDAHNGARPSRRGDMEILGYCLIQWASGDLPWMGFLNNKPKVAAEKKRYKSNASEVLKASFKDEKPPKCLQNYMSAVYQYEYDETPDYESLKALFNKELKDNGWEDNKDGLDWLTDKKKPKRTDKEQLPGPSPKKKRFNCNGEASAGSRRSARIAHLSPQKRMPSETEENDDEEKETKKKKQQPISEKEKCPPLDKKVILPRKRTTKKDARDKLVSKKSNTKSKQLSSKSKSPQKRSHLSNQNRLDDNNVIAVLSPSKKLPAVFYPSELGYVERLTEPETFGSLASKKKC